MKFHKLIEVNEDELYFEELDIKFLVHKSLINKNTRKQIQKYMESLKEPEDMNVEIRNNVYIFTPSDCDEDGSGITACNYLWYAL